MEYLVWGGFLLLIFLFLALDLGVFNKKAHEISTKEAFGWTLVWISMALIFNVFVYFAYENHWFEIGVRVGENLTGKDAALNFFTGYLIEKTLSIDNIFVIALVFAYFNVPLKYQHRILFWGILGALIFRGLMIGVGVALLHAFSWITYVFGALLIYSAYKILTAGNEDVNPEKNAAVRFVRKFMVVSNELSDGKFFVKKDGKRAITVYFIVLVVVETTDVMFAIDSIPAIFAITTDAFLVFTSNVFAILGLRSLYFVLASVIEKFKYLKISLVFVLGFVGVKMLIVHYYKLPILISLGVIAVMLGAGIVASIIANKKEAKMKINS